MKALIRVLCIFFALILLFPSAPAVFAEEGGLRFYAIDGYFPQKGLDIAPNSLEAWIKLPKSAASERAGVIIGNYSAGRSVVNLEIHKNGRPRLYFTDIKGVTADWTFTAINVCTDEWTHVAIVRDVAAGKVHCYINGVLKQSLAITDGKGVEDAVPATGLMIGGDLRAGNTQYFKGEIRDIAVFSTVRTQADITMQSPVGGDGLIAYYDLRGHKRGTDIEDKSGNGNDVYYTANSLWVSEASAPAGDYAYSFAVIGDTQIMNYTYPDKFGTIYDWILENIEEKKIRFVLGLGDITDKSGADEWERAKAAIHSLDGRVDYNFVRGNHDKKDAYNTAFPWKDYKDVFDGSYGNSMLYTYRTLDIGEVKYLFITLDYGANDAALAWAGKLCDKYPDRNVIITTHAYLFRDGTTLDQNDVCPPATTGGSNNGDDMWNKLISKHENIVLVISGHDPCDRVVVTQTEGEHGNTVTQMLVDPQSADKTYEALGMVAMLYFSEDGRNVTVRYYSTVKKMLLRSVNLFSFTLDTVGTEAAATEPVTEPATEAPHTEAPTAEVTEATEAPNTSAPPADGAEGGTVSIVIISAVSAAAIAAAVLVLTKIKKHK